MALPIEDENSFRWAMGEIARAFIHGLMVAWALWVADANFWRALAVGTVIGFLILSGVAWRRLEQLSLMAFGLGLIVWAHIPVVDHFLDLSRSWHR